MCFYFQSYVQHRVLHSFPTRRSSDLVVVTMKDQCRHVELLEIRGEIRLGERLDAKVGRQDRKSTRLNSSHVAISYAVFCLKKKTSSRARHTVPMTPSPSGDSRR